MRLDHWIKQVFIVPGFICAMIMTHQVINKALCIQLLLAFIATSMIASANYVINEWLDAAFDKYHPIKKTRSVVTENVKKNVLKYLPVYYFVV